MYYTCLCSASQSFPEQKERGKDQSGHSCVFRQKEQQPGAFCSDCGDFYLPLPHLERACRINLPAQEVSRSSVLTFLCKVPSLTSTNRTHTHTFMAPTQHNTTWAQYKVACTQHVHSAHDPIMNIDNNELSSVSGFTLLRRDCPLWQRQHCHQMKICSSSKIEYHPG